MIGVRRSGVRGGLGKERLACRPGERGHGAGKTGR